MDPGSTRPTQLSVNLPILPAPTGTRGLVERRLAARGLVERRLAARGLLGQLREAAASSGASLEEMATILTTLGVEAADVHAVGERLSKAARKAEQAIKRFRNAKKRLGTIEEVVLAEALAAQLEDARAKYARIASDPNLGPSLAAIQAILDDESLKRVVSREIERAAAPKLRAHKELRALLKDPQFKKFERLVLAELKARADALLEELVAEGAANAIPADALGGVDLAALERLIATGDLLGLVKSELRKRVRAFAGQQLARLIVKVQSGGIVVQLATEIVLRWLGPKLREATRFKGKVDRRTRRTLKGFDNRAKELRRLGCDDLEHARLVIARAETALAATRFLKRDLRGRSLLDKLKAGEVRLTKLKNATRKRCRIGSAAAQAALQEYIDAVQASREAVTELQDGLGSSSDAEQADCPTGDLEVTVSPGGPTTLTFKGAASPSASQLTCSYESPTGFAKVNIEINWTPDGSTTLDPAGACHLGPGAVLKEGFF